MLLMWSPLWAPGMHRVAAGRLVMSWLLLMVVMSWLLLLLMVVVVMSWLLLLLMVVVVMSWLLLLLMVVVVMGRHMGTMGCWHLPGWSLRVCRILLVSLLLGLLGVPLMGIVNFWQASGITCFGLCKEVIVLQSSSNIICLVAYNYTASSQSQQQNYGQLVYSRPYGNSDMGVHNQAKACRSKQPTLTFHFVGLHPPVRFTLELPLAFV